MKYCPVCGFVTEDKEICFCADDGSKLIEKSEEVKNAVLENQLDTSFLQNIPIVSLDDDIKNNTIEKDKLKYSSIWIALLSVLCFVLLIVAFSLNMKIEEAKTEANDKTSSLKNMYPDLIVKAGDFYGTDKYGENRIERPFHHSSLKYLCNNYRILINPYVNYKYNNDDVITIKIIDMSRDEVHSVLTKELDDTHFGWGSESGGSYSVGWYMVQWIYDDEILCEKSFYVNW